MSKKPTREELEKRIHDLELSALECKLAKEALEKNKSFFEGIVECMTDWIWEVGADGRYTFCSKKIKAVLGYSPEEILGKTPFDFMAPDEAERIGKIFKNIVSKKESIKNLENWNIHKNGRPVCLLTNGVPLIDEDGNLTGFRGVDSDITERKQMLITLQESEARLKSILFAIPGPMVIYNNKGEPEYLNTAFTGVFGWTLDELKGRRIPFVPDDEKEATGEKIKELFTIGGSVLFETKRLTKQGKQLNVIISAAIIKNVKDEITNMVVNLTDITEQKKMKQKTREASDNFNNVYNNAFSAISTIDGDRFIDCNTAFVDMLNAGAKEEVLNTHPSKLSPSIQPDGRASFEKANEMIDIAFEKGFNNFEWIHKKITGETFPVDVSLTRTNFKGKPVLHCVWKDLSAEKTMIQTLNSAKEKAEVAVKTKEIGRASCREIV